MSDSLHCHTVREQKNTTDNGCFIVLKLGIINILNNLLHA